MPHHQYFDRTGRELSKFEATDARGLLLDGCTMRVRKMMRDSANSTKRRVVDGRRPDDWRSLHRPGFRVSDSLDATLAQVGRADVYRRYEEYITNAWRNPTRDAAPYGAYPYSASAEGKACTIDGRPGRLVKQGNWLVCKPTSTDAHIGDQRVVCPDCGGAGDIDGDECERCGGEGEIDDEEYENEDAARHADHRMTVDEMRAKHAATMTRVYDAYANELREAWKKG